jgi:UDP-3-O-acyl-N-acetylglucosamine deacetylase
VTLAGSRCVEFCNLVQCRTFVNYDIVNFIRLVCNCGGQKHFEVYISQVSIARTFLFMSDVF